MDKKLPEIKSKEFYCPLGNGIMWWRKLEYKECPLVPAHRDMPECKECKLRVDIIWELSKETWKDKPIKKKKFKKKKKRGERR